MDVFEEFKKMIEYGLQESHVEKNTRALYLLAINTNAHYYRYCCPFP